jgi:hypothetical protein
MMSLWLGSGIIIYCFRVYNKPYLFRNDFPLFFQKIFVIEPEGMCGSFLTFFFIYLSSKMSIYYMNN